VEAHARRALAPRTRKRYDSILRTYLLPTFGATPIGRLGRPEIKEWFAALDASPATARKVQIVLSAILSEGVELGLLRDNPAARLRLATPPRRDMTVLTAAEIARSPRRSKDRKTASRCTSPPTPAYVPGSCGRCGAQT